MLSRISAATITVASLMASTPAAAQNAGMLATTSTEAGAFAGARLRLRLGGKSMPRPEFGVTFAPMLRAASADGRVRMRFGEGAGFGIAGGEPARLSLGGRPVLSFTERRVELDKTNAMGVSTIGYVAIGAGVALVVGALLFKDALDDASE